MVENQTHESKESQNKMPLAEAEKILGTGADYDHVHVLNCYSIAYWVNAENNELHKNDPVVLAKNVLIRSLVERQIKENGHFDLSDNPLENKCPDCKGTGELYKIWRKRIEDGCKKCVSNGEAIKFLGERYDPKMMKISNKPEDKDLPSGKTIVKCRKCENGRFIQGSHEKGLRINVMCKTCNGKGQVLVKCKTCRGKKVISKPVLANKIEKTTECRTCRGKGFLTPKEEKHIAPKNPVFSKNIGEAIKVGEIPPEVDSRLSQKTKHI